jgi:hypothetical protein
MRWLRGAGEGATTVLETVMAQRPQEAFLVGQDHAEISAGGNGL